MEKKLNTRIKIDCRTFAEWELANPIAQKGEIMIVESPNIQEDVTLSSNYLIKIGDGVTDFHNLQYISALSADVYPWALESTKPIYTLEEIKNFPFILIDLSGNNKDMATLKNGSYVVEKSGSFYNTYLKTPNLEQDHISLNTGDLIFKTDSGTQIISGISSYYITDYTKEFSQYFYLTSKEHNDDLEQKLNLKQDALKFTDNVIVDSRTKVVKAIIPDSNKTLIFETKENLLDWLNNSFIREDNKVIDDLNIGDSLCIKEEGVSDYWWDGNQIQSFEIKKEDVVKAMHRNYKLICDDTLTEPVTYVLKNQDLDGNPLNLSHALIKIQTPVASVTDGLIIKCTDIMAGTTPEAGGCGFANTGISSTAERHSIIEMDCSNYFIYTILSTGATSTNLSLHSKNINIYFTSINNILIRLNNVESTFPAGTKIKIWGY